MKCRHIGCAWGLSISMANIGLKPLKSVVSRQLRETKMLFSILETRTQDQKSTIICSQRNPESWAAMIMNDEISANAIVKRVTKHYTIMINTK